MWFDAVAAGFGDWAGRVPTELRLLDPPGLSSRLQISWHRRKSGVTAAGLEMRFRTLGIRSDTGVDLAGALAVPLPIVLMSPVARFASPTLFPGAGLESVGHLVRNPA